MKSLFVFLAFITTTFSRVGCTDSNKPEAHKSASDTLLPLQGTYWKLYSLMGNIIPDVDSAKAKEAHIVFNKDGTEGGNGGCNQFGGNYELEGNSKIFFGPIISTKMYCDNAKYENLFFDLLSKADNYLIKGDTLYLRSKLMDSTAHFVSVPKK